MTRVHVFEATNDKRRERYVGFTSEPIAEALASFQKHPPAAIAHWRQEDTVTCRSVEEDLVFDEAYDFVERYADIMRSAGWKTFVELPRRYGDLPLGSRTPD